MDKRELTERDICTKFIVPAVKSAGWDEMVHIREEVYFTKGRIIIVRGKLVTRGKAKKADFVLYYKPNIPINTPRSKNEIAGRFGAGSPCVDSTGDFEMASAE
jgi:type I restriction enzyme R subunit